MHSTYTYTLIGHIYNYRRMYTAIIHVVRECITLHHVTHLVVLFMYDVETYYMKNGDVDDAVHVQTHTVLTLN